MRISTESRKAKSKLSNTIANQKRVKYHKQPIRVQSNQANCLKRENLVG